MGHIESLPPFYRTHLSALATRIMVCTGLGKWEMGTELVGLIESGGPVELRRLAGQFHLAHAEALCAAGSIEAAKQSVRSLSEVWPEGRARALDSKALAAIW